MYKLLIGHCIAGRYHVEALLGTGGMGAVYRATDTTLDREVALKVISFQNADADSQGVLRKRFQREARIAARIRHPHVVTIFDFVRDDALDLEGIVMELLSGEDLHHRIRRSGPLPLDAGLRVLAAAARGVAAGHRAGLLHRDIKPANIFLSRDERTGREHVHVLDFGIALDTTTAVGTTSTHLTAFGRNPLSPQYASPEQSSGHAGLTPASDVFSLAMTGYMALTGSAAFTPDQIHHVGIGGPEARLRIPGDWPSAVGALFTRALTARAAARHQSADEFADAVEEALEGVGRSRVTPPTPIVLAVGEATEFHSRPADKLANVAVTPPRRLAGQQAPAHSQLAGLGVAVMLAILAFGTIGDLWDDGRVLEATSPGLVVAPTLTEDSQETERPLPLARRSQERQSSRNKSKSAGSKVVAEPPRVIQDARWPVRDSAARPDYMPERAPEPDSRERSVEGRSYGAGAPSTGVYELSAVEELPSISNRQELVRQLARNYPPLLRDAGVTGTVQVRFRVLENGTVDVPSISVTSSTHEGFNDASIRSVQRLRFRPAKIDNRPVKVWIELPIQWHTLAAAPDTAAHV